MFTLVWNGLKKNMSAEIKKRLRLAIEDLVREDIPKDRGSLLCILKQAKSRSECCVEVFHLIECAEKMILDELDQDSVKSNHHVTVHISWIEPPEYLTSCKTMLLEVDAKEDSGSLIGKYNVFECIDTVLRAES